MKRYIVAFALLVLVSCKDKDTTTNSTEIPTLTCGGSKDLCNKKYNEVAWIMTHNAFNYADKYLVPNQDYTIKKQLEDGVRGLMLDVYDSPSGVILYHGFEALGKELLKNELKVIKDFLKENPTEIVSIIFQNECSHATLTQTIEDAGLDSMAYTFSGTFVTLKEMIENNQRLFMFVENKKSSEVRPAWLHYAWDIVFDCPFDNKKVADFSSTIFRGGDGSKKLYLVNHWLSNSLGIPERKLAITANKYDILKAHIDSCITNNQFVNFVGLDFYNIGDAKKIVNELNGI